MHKFFSRAAVDVTPHTSRKPPSPPPVKIVTCWASRALQTKFGRAVALRKKGDYLEVLISESADQAGRWYPAEVVLSNNMVTKWTGQSTFSPHQR
jgi:hypothetical protein